MPEPGPAGSGWPSCAADGVLDGPVARAAAQVALEVAGQVLLLFVVNVAAVISMPAVQKPHWKPCRSRNCCCTGCSVARPRRRRPGQPFDGGDGVALGADGRVDAAVHRRAVHVHGAGTAVAAVAALLDAQVALLAQERPQALAGARRELSAGVPLISMAMHQAPSCCVVCRGRRTAGLCGGQKSPDTRGGPMPGRGQFVPDLVGEAVRHVAPPGRQPVDVVVVQAVRDGAVQRGCSSAASGREPKRSCTGRFVAAVTVSVRAARRRRAFRSAARRTGRGCSATAGGTPPGRTGPTPGG